MVPAVMMRPEQIHYDAVETWIRESIATGRYFLFDHRLFREELTRTWDKFDFPYESLHSFIRNLHVIHVKKTAPAVKESLAVYLDEYKNGRTIKELAKRANFPPYLFSRYVVEAVAVTTGLNSKKGLTKAMKDPMNELGTLDKIAPEYHASEKQFAGDAASSTTTRLAIQVKEAIDSDPMYGPQHDKERHIVGVEYEVVLEHYLLETGIPFETEAQLRDRGTSRTPDVLLSAPVGIEVPRKDGDGTEWKVVCWIDSKALFGDVNTHQSSVLPQAESYVHRFGPGLVIYWFGHAPLARLGDAQGDLVIAGWDIPSAFMLPTGEVLRSNEKRGARRSRT